MQYQATQPLEIPRWSTSARIDREVADDAIGLHEGETLARTPSDVGGLQVHCVTGVLWITQSGSNVDTILRADDTFVARGRGKVVVQAIGDATLRLTSSRR